MTLVGKDHKQINTHRDVRMEVEACVYMVNLDFVSLSTLAKYNIIVKLVSIYLNAKLSKVNFKGIPRLAIGGDGSFGKNCGYRHTNPTVNPEKKSLKKKVNCLEYKVQEMAIKIIQVEVDLDGLKQNENKKESEVEQ